MLAYLWTIQLKNYNFSYHFRSRKRKTSTLSLNSSLTNGGDHQAASDVIALGTASGKVLIYSLKTGDVSSTIKDDYGTINAVVSFVLKFPALFTRELVELLGFCFCFVDKARI
jgi:WD40 repeat protein